MINLKFDRSRLANQKLIEKVAIAALVALLSINGIVAFAQIHRLRAHTNRVENSFTLLRQIEAIESTLKSAESGQRGFIITGEETYLEPYTAAVIALDSLLSQVTSLIMDDDQSIVEKIRELKRLASEKMDELASTIAVRRDQGFEEAQSLVANNLGKRTMDSISSIVHELRVIENQHVEEYEVTAATTFGSALLTSLLSTVASLVLVVAVLYILQRNRLHAEETAAAIRSEHELLQASLARNTHLEIENRRMDQYMRSIIEQVQDYAIFGMDDQCCATTWNEGVKHVLGFEEGEFLGHDVRKLIFTPEAIEIGIPQAEFETAAKEGRASDDRWMMTKEGKRFWASGITSAVKDANGKLIGFSKVMRDLTERKRDEDEMAALAASLSETDRRKNEFLATLAHELRNPLAPIKNAIDLMSMSYLSPENQELRDTVARQVQQVIRLIDDLLDISRIGHGKLTLQKSIVDLRDIIKSSVEASVTFVREKKQNLTVSICDSPSLVHVDPARITQVFSNLLNNSSRYSDSDSNIELTLSVDSTDGEFGTATVVVRDDGIGISQERLGEIFQMFSQVQDLAGRGNAGLGIGLTLVKTLVELHGGTVSAHSDGLGRGSCFTVKLPLASEAVLASPPPAIANETPILFRSFKVLVVEDMRALRTIMSRLLQRLGHEVEVAEDGLEALEVLTNFDAEIIFSDIAMPGMTGYDLARKLRETSSCASTYLVAMTGYGQFSDRTQSRESGFDEHMVKPVDIQKLRDLFERLTRKLQ